MFRPKIEHFRHGISSSVISSSALGQYLIRTKLKLGADVSTDDQHLKKYLDLGFVHQQTSVTNDDVRFSI